MDIEENEENKLNNKLLKETYNEYMNLYKNIKEEEKFESLLKIVNKIDVDPSINLDFLVELKKGKKEYNINNEVFNYDKKFNLLKGTLTIDGYKQLTGKSESINPIGEIKDLLLNIIDTNKDKKLIQIDEMPEFNFPIIYGIERLRLEFYKTYINLKSRDDFNIFKEYIDIIDEDNEIKKYSINNYELCPKIFLFVLILTELLDYTNNKKFLNLFFIKNTTKYIKSNSIFNFPNMNYNIEDKGDHYLVNINDKIENINKDDYIIESLISDIMKYNDYPLKILLMRNKSYKKYMEDWGDKGFLKELELYDSFIKYVKLFLKSNSITQLFNKYESLKNIYSLIKNEKYLDEILSDKHFKFLPFFQINNYFGFTNKQFLISIINSIPEIIDGIQFININDENNLYLFCLLFSITCKFITTLYEIVIHLTSSYLNFNSEKKLDSSSPKGKFSDGGYYFESLIFGKGKRIKKLKIVHIIALLDGVSCQKNLGDFQNDLNDKLHLDKIIERKNKNQLRGFLGDFLKKFDFDFGCLRKSKNISKVSISYRKLSNIAIKFDSQVISSAWGYGAKCK